MMRRMLLATAAASVLAPCLLSAQFLGQSETVTTANRMPEQFWSPKPTNLTPYEAPNRVHWKLSEILSSHAGQTNWVQPLIRNREQEADYISMAPGNRTKTMMYADDRVVFIVQDGSIRVTMDGREPFVATKGFMVNVPFRHLYALETVSSVPSLRFEVRQAGSAPLYPVSETPTPIAGKTYIRVTGSPGPALERESNPIYVDFWKNVASGTANYNSKFVWDDHFTSNILRGAAATAVPPDTNVGHFHGDWTEFWFIMEGKIGYKIEGFDYFEADQGDVVTAAQGRFHRAGNSPLAPMSTRIPFNPRPPILHNSPAPAN